MEYNYITWIIIIFTYTILCFVKCQLPPDMFPPDMDMFPPFMNDADAPVLDITPEVVVVTQGKTAVLPCHVKNQGQTLVSWFDSELIFQIATEYVVKIEDSRFSVNTSVPGDWNLVIANVQPADADSYICMLQTFPPQTKIITLNVTSPPSIDKESLSQRYLFQRGDSLVVMCKVVGDPRPSVTWYAYRTKSSSMEEVKEMVSSSSTLVFKNLESSDGGIYRCEAENSIGKDMFEIFVQEVYEPRLSTTMKTIVVKEHSPAKLQCEVESNPQAGIGWQRNEETLKTDASSKYFISLFAESDTKKVTELTIRYTEMSDSGEYVCVASNRYGINHIRYHVKVRSESTITSTRESIPIEMQDSTTEKNEKATVIYYTQQPEGKEPDSTTLSYETKPEEPKTGSSHSAGYTNTYCLTLILICTLALLIVL